MVRASSPAKLRPWSELTAKMVMGVVPGLATKNAQEHVTMHKQRATLYRRTQYPHVFHPH